MERILSAVAVGGLILFASLLLVAAVAYPMHVGEPTYFHVARLHCLVAACTCALVSAVSATVATLCKSK